MKKNLLVLFLLALLIGCTNSSRNVQSDKSSAQVAEVKLTTDELLADPASYNDQKVLISGMVSHVCKHGGQKMFLYSQLADRYLRINTGTDIPEFPVDLEGSNVEVKGVVKEFEQEGTKTSEPAVEQGHQSDTSSLENDYHRDNFYVIVAESYTVKD